MLANTLQLHQLMNLYSMKHKSNIHILELNAYTAPKVFEERNEDFVSIGEDNNYYQYIIDRYVGSTTNHAILNGVTNFVYGHGIDATDSSEKIEQYAQMKSLLKNKDLFRVVQDFVILGEGAFQENPCIWNIKRAK